MKEYRVRVMVITM